MKKATMIALVNYLNDMIGMNGGEADTEEFIVNARDEMTAELNKGAEEKARNAELYESAKAVVMDELSVATEAVTISELYEAVADKLPEGFTKGKLQYAVTRLWVADGSIVKVEGKVNTYRKA